MKTKTKNERALSELRKSLKAINQKIEATDKIILSLIRQKRLADANCYKEARKELIAKACKAIRITRLINTLPTLTKIIFFYFGFSYKTITL
jgi:hypothetical protein